ncbi:Hypothetical protein, partial CDS, partial [Neorhizobium galegae bv. orientalis]
MKASQFSDAQKELARESAQLG